MQSDVRRGYLVCGQLDRQAFRILIGGIGAVVFIFEFDDPPRGIPHHLISGLCEPHHTIFITNLS